MRPRPLVHHLLLACLLLVAQQHAVLHWLSHATVAAAHPGQVHHVGDGCSECVGLTPFAAAVGSSPFTLPPMAGFPPLSAPSTWTAIDTARLSPYLSRAPPLRA
jgi:hypothetical protein